MILFKEFSFEAAHFLPNVPKDHKCRNMHGHSYKIKIFLKGAPDNEMGWIMDFADLKKIVAPCLHRLDHQCLNNIPGLNNPTSENLATWLWKELNPLLPGLFELHVYETESSGCIYIGD